MEDILKWCRNLKRIVSNYFLLIKLLDHASEIRKESELTYGKSLYLASIDYRVYDDQTFGTNSDPLNGEQNSYRFINKILGSLAASRYLKTDEAWRLRSKYGKQFVEL